MVRTCLISRGWLLIKAWERIVDKVPSHESNFIFLCCLGSYWFLASAYHLLQLNWKKKANSSLWSKRTSQMSGFFFTPYYLSHWPTSWTVGLKFWRELKYSHTMTLLYPARFLFFILLHLISDLPTEKRLLDRSTGLKSEVECESYEPYCTYLI